MFPDFYDANVLNNQFAIQVLTLVVIAIIVYLYMYVRPLVSEGMNVTNALSAGASQRVGEVFRSDGYATAASNVSDVCGVNTGVSGNCAKSAEGMYEYPSFWNPGSYEESNAAVRASLTEDFHPDMAQQEPMTSRANVYEGLNEFEQNPLNVKY